MAYEAMFATHVHVIVVYFQTQETRAFSPCVIVKDGSDPSILPRTLQGITSATKTQFVAEGRCCV
jgi:hypothetical protein